MQREPIVLVALWVLFNLILGHSFLFLLKINALESQIEM